MHYYLTQSSKFPASIANIRLGQIRQAADDFIRLTRISDSAAGEISFAIDMLIFNKK